MGSEVEKEIMATEPETDSGQAAEAAMANALVDGQFPPPASATAPTVAAPIDTGASPAGMGGEATVMPTSGTQPQSEPGARLNRRLIAVLAGAGLVTACVLSAVLVSAIGRCSMPRTAGTDAVAGKGKTEVIEGDVSEVEVGASRGSTKFELLAAEALRDGTDDLAGTNLHGHPEEDGTDVQGGESPKEKPETPEEGNGDDGSAEGTPDQQDEQQRQETPRTTVATSLADVVSMEMMRDNFVHGPLPADKVRYIVMHDTESGTDSATAIASSWGDGHIAAHFVVGKDGTIIQCVPIDAVAHHAGNADYGQNDAYGIWPERDDEVGRTGSGDYAMNAWSIGIEIVHEHDDGAYPEAQLAALDRLVAAIDAAIGHQPQIIDHKAWAGSRKQDVSDDFPMGAYQRGRRHDA